MTRILEIAKTNYSSLLQQVHELGIKTVSEKNWLVLKSTAELILNPKFAVFQIHQHIHKLKQKLPDKSVEFNAAPYQEVIQWARLIQPNYRKRQAKTIECLNDPLWWHHCVEKVKTLPIESQEHARIRYPLD